MRDRFFIGIFKNSVIFFFYRKFIITFVYIFKIYRPNHAKLQKLYDMKKTLPLSLAILATLTATAETLPVKSGLLSGEYAHSLSDNGQWLVSEIDQEMSLKATNLLNPEQYVVWIFSGIDEDRSFNTGFTRDVSDNGIVVGEDWNIPAYFDMNADKPQWIALDGVSRNMGVVSACVGAITPDGTMIVGAIGDKGMMDFDEQQMTYPCLWRRQADGTFGKVEYLPNPGKDYFGEDPQYVNCTSVSADGSVIGVSMRSGSGFWHFPYVYILGEDGKYTPKMLGESLVNPNGIEVVPSPGDYYGPEAPNYELYMTREELAKLMGPVGQAWLESQIAAGVTEDWLPVYELQFAATLMSDAERAEYEPLLNAFLEEYVPWLEARLKYEEFLNDVADHGISFSFNNVYLSPDGKYLYATAIPGTGGNYFPVRFDVATGEATLYDNSKNMLISGITSDYSVLTHEYSEDSDLYRMAYIYPQGETKPMTIIDYWKHVGNTNAYNFMEDNCYRGVLTGFTSQGAPQFDDTWTVGKPVTNADMSIMAFANSTAYWEVVPDPNSFMATFILNTTADYNAVESVEAGADISLNIVGAGCVEVKGEVKSLEIYDLSGTKVYAVANPQGVVATNLAGGVYVVRAVKANGEALTRKALF